MISLPVDADEGQRLAAEQLMEIASVGTGFEVLSITTVPELPGWLQVECRLTAPIRHMPPSRNGPWRRT